MKNWIVGIIVFVWLVAVFPALAQTTPLDVRAGAVILNFNSTVLPGTLTGFGCANAPGGLVQILMVGSNSVAHLPNLDGTPSGGDTVLFTTVIGDYNGLNPCTLGHQLATSFSPRPANGTKIFARVFNAPTTSSATYWGQSATFTVNGSAVFDLSAAGLKATTMPKGVDLATTVDAKGLTYLYELTANTNPLVPNDVFAANAIAFPSAQPLTVSALGRTGRSYTLQRSTNDLTAVPMVWTDISNTGMLSADTSLVLSDPTPPPTPKAFYRVKVTMP